ncbi:Acyl-coenzyme A:6-aminopenicillanic acid acyl-transferase [Gimesia panareensis]|uniref:Acyl-coenzyme A:6-aminopenicillanic acid acyl-transferase n=1 Tax=Gimesia panareensis TaxID=2527978 RepID=A0A518FIS0_9PLAN|nr:C45 family peptidase [Gimesia panareensis]QDV16236.1 Acyl-coenzyme A:6-aminopenicillanic acid acyl-transferase [Gimesia panareensis]
MRRCLLVTIVLAIACFCFTETLPAEGYLTSIGTGPDRIPVVVVKGTPYEMGKQQGKLIRTDATEMILSLVKKVQAAGPERASDASLDAAWNAIAPHTDPRFKEELRGFAEGSGIDLRTLQRAHALPVVMDYSCSSIATWGSATKNGHLYQTRNLDWTMNLGVQDYPCITVYIPKQGTPHVNITFAGFIGANTGMNAKGIVLSEMGDSPGKDYPFDMNGVHFTTLFREVMYDAQNLDQAIDQFQQAKRIKKYHYVVGDGTSGRAVKMLAHAPDLIIWKDNDPSDELAPAVMKDLVYQDEGRGAFQPLQKVYGKIGPHEMRDIACQIPIKGGNILDVIYDATALEFWVSYAEKQDEAYKRPFVHFKLKDYLK